MRPLRDSINVTLDGCRDHREMIADEDLHRHAAGTLKQQPGQGIAAGGVTLPRTLAALGVIDEYEIIVHPRLAGHGPTLFAGRSPRLDLTLAGRQEFSSGAVAMR
jgi:dihydrofolate reductase